MELLQKPPFMIITGSSGESLYGLDQKSFNNPDAISGWAPDKRGILRHPRINNQLQKASVRLPRTRNLKESDAKQNLRPITPQNQPLKLKILPISVPIFSPYTHEPRFRGHDTKKFKNVKKIEQEVTDKNSGTPKLVELVSKARERILMPDFSMLNFPHNNPRDPRRPITSSVPRDSKYKYPQAIEVKKFNKSINIKNPIQIVEDLRPSDSTLSPKIPVDYFEPRIRPRHENKRAKMRSVNLKLNKSVIQELDISNDQKNNNSTIEMDGPKKSGRDTQSREYDGNILRPYSVRNARRYFDPLNFSSMFFRKQSNLKKSINLEDQSSRSPSVSQSPLKIEHKPNTRYLNEPSDRIKGYLRKLTFANEINPSQAKLSPRPGSSIPSPRMIIMSNPPLKSPDNYGNQSMIDFSIDNFSPHCDDKQYNNSYILESSQPKRDKSLRSSRDLSEISKIRSPRIGPWEGTLLQ